MLKEVCKHDSYYRKVALKICEDKMLADDLVQEMYLKLYRYDCKKVKSMIENGVIKFVCSRMLTQLFIDTKRTSKKEIEFNCYLTPIHQQTENEKVKQIEKEMENLYWFDKRLFESYIYDGHTMRSLADATGIPLRRIFVTIKKVKEQIRKKL